MTKNKNIIIVLCLILPAILLSYFSFKMHESSFYKNPQGVPFWVHDEPRAKRGTFIYKLLHSGVCPLGKFGALSIFTISVITFIFCLLYLYNPQKYEKEIKVIRALNLSLLAIVFILSLLMNRYLFVRSIPYYILQLTIVILLYKL